MEADVWEMCPSISPPPVQAKENRVGGIRAGSEWSRDGSSGTPIRGCEGPGEELAEIKKSRGKSERERGKINQYTVGGGEVCPLGCHYQPACGVGEYIVSVGAPPQGGGVLLPKLDLSVPLSFLSCSL